MCFLEKKLTNYVLAVIFIMCRVASKELLLNPLIFSTLGGIVCNDAL